jgi:uncharacterized protein YndB with AHSA1/START domain
MAAVTESIEIARPPSDVFAYATDFANFPEWQAGVLSAQPHGTARPTLGSTAIVTRKGGPRTLERTEEITEFDPPHRWTVRGTGGAVTAIARGAIEPDPDGNRSRVTIALTFEGRGIAKLLVPLVIRRQAHRQLPTNMRQLKQRLEDATPSPAA